jgi:signal transduction histidine kinase
MAFFQDLVNTGVSFGKNRSEKRGILLSNLVSLVLFILGSLLFVAYYYWYGWWFVTGMIEVISGLSLLPIFFNRLNLSKLSRIWITVLIPITALALSIYAKALAYDTQQELDYFTFRFVILATCVFPVIFFSLKEKSYMLFTLIIGFTTLMLFDPLHTIFGVPYKRDVLKVYNYYFTNIVVLVTYIVLVGAVIFLRWISETSEEKAEKLINELNEKNSELGEKNDEIETQNHEIRAQADNLNTSQRKLQDAYKLIEDQKELLVKVNKHLSSELVETNKDLTATNNELIRHNNELRQFSYTVSHNLRGPVASLSGLINLIDVNNLNTETSTIYEHIQTSIQKLENVIKDLSHIIDIRNDIFHIRKKVNLVQETEEIFELLKKEVDSYEVVIKTDLNGCSEIYSVRPMIHSILYNLISNALKYRSTDRRPEVKISAREQNRYIIIEVIDNGLGIDLKSHKQNLFKLYKRFHFHTEGKGLGLYLVKLQAEALGGYVEVESEINRFTKFSVHIPKPENIEQQVLYKSPTAKIFYDARLNSTGVIWDGPISSDQYRSVFTQCLEFVKAYNTPNYIADLTNQGYIIRQDQHWMFTSILPEAAKYGLKRIAAVRPVKSDPQLKEYFNGIAETLAKLGIEQAFFSSFDEATNWIEIQNDVRVV